MVLSNLFTCQEKLWFLRSCRFDFRGRIPLPKEYSHVCHLRLGGRKLPVQVQAAETILPGKSNTGVYENLAVRRRASHSSKHGGVGRSSPNGQEGLHPGVGLVGCGSEGLVLPIVIGGRHTVEGAIDPCKRIKHVRLEIDIEIGGGDCHTPQPVPCLHRVHRLNKWGNGSQERWQEEQEQMSATRAFNSLNSCHGCRIRLT